MRKKQLSKGYKFPSAFRDFSSFQSDQVDEALPPSSGSCRLGRRYARGGVATLYDDAGSLDGSACGGSEVGSCVPDIWSIR